MEKNSTMILFPNAKINLGLQIISKRPDGYHNISTLFYPAPIFDILEIVKSSDKKTSISVSGIDTMTMIICALKPTISWPRSTI